MNILKKAEKLGMIPKSDLENGAFYKGSCRNTWIAMWDKKHQVFHYLRVKFGNVFVETLKHPSDDDGYDVFIPIEKLEKGGGK